MSVIFHHSRSFIGYTDGNIPVPVSREMGNHPEYCCVVEYMSLENTMPQFLPLTMIKAAIVRTITKHMQRNYTIPRSPSLPDDFGRFLRLRTRNFRVTNDILMTTS